MITKFIQHNPKGINIHAAVILLTPVHLRCHVRIRSFLGKGTQRPVQLTRNSEISQFKFPKSGYKDIFRLNIPMNDIHLSAIFQSFAKVDAQLDHFFFTKLLPFTIFQKSRQILHADINIPPNIIQIFHYFIIFNSHYMGITPKVFHNIDFLNTIFHQILKIFFDRLVASQFGLYTLQFTAARRNRDNLDCGIKCFITVHALCFIHFSKRSFADLFNNFPFRPYRDRQFPIHKFHLCTFPEHPFS